MVPVEVGMPWVGEEGSAAQVAQDSWEWHDHECYKEKKEVESEYVCVMPGVATMGPGMVVPKSYVILLV